MYIHILKTFDDLGTSYQAGQKLHVPTSLGERYVFAGVAEQVKYKSYVDRLQAEEAERARLNPIPPATVVWAVVKGMLSERYYISAKCSRANCTALAYDAPPSSSLEQLQFLHSCDGSAPENIPAAVAAQYRNLFKQPAEVGADVANYFHNCAKSKGDGERVDLYAPQTINGVVVGPPVLFDHPVNSKFNNYGWENARPNPGDGQKMDLTPSNPVFKERKK